MNFKNYIRLICLVSMLSLLGCGQSTQPFERIDDWPRVIDFVYKNLSDTTLCESAPGDSVLLVAILAGGEATQIDWKVSFDVATNKYNKDTALNIHSLDYTQVPYDSASFPNAQCVAIKFKIPDNIAFVSQSINDDVLKSMGVDRATIVGLLNSYSKADSLERNTDPTFREFSQLFNIYSNVVLQSLTAKCRIFMTMNKYYRVESDFAVRYNRHFTGFPNVVVNKNPIINFMGIYKVKGNPTIFKSMQLSQYDTAYCLYKSNLMDPSVLGQNIKYTDTILLDSGFTYFLAGDTGVFGGEDFRDFGITLQGTINREDYFSQWFFKLDKTECSGVDTADYLIVSNGTSFLDRMYLPLDTHIVHVTLWLQSYDRYLGELSRPAGSSDIEKSIVFKYSSTYLEYLKRQKNSGIRM